MLICSQLEPGGLPNSFSLPRHGAVLLIENIGGPLGRKGSIISGTEVAFDLLLVEERIPGNFRCTGTYSVQMHKKQTNFLLYILDR